jgi:hypothetical protein
MSRIAMGLHVGATIRRLEQLFPEVDCRGACHYPDGVVRFVRTALRTFEDEVARHNRHHECRLSEPPTLPIPAADRSWR